MKDISDETFATIASARAIPWLAPTEAQAARAFESLKAASSSLVSDYQASCDTYGFTWIADLQYSMAGLKASDSFSHFARMRTGGHNRHSPHEVWTGDGITEERRAYVLGRILGSARRLSRERQTVVSALRAGTRLSNDVHYASQFKPLVARDITLYFGAEKVADFCSGWGDRMVGVLAAGAEYFGCDVNQNAVYAQRCCAAFHGHTPDITLFSERAEDMDWPQGMDLVLTSPPYYGAERYDMHGQNEQAQSWRLYPDRQEWIDSFLLEAVKRAVASLKTGGHLALNIADTSQGVPYVGEVLTKIGLLGMRPLGFFGMRMKRRPATKKAGTLRAEAIYVFEKVSP